MTEIAGIAWETPDLQSNTGVMVATFILSTFTNPPGLGQTKGSNSVEEGLMAMLQSMEAGKFKVFNTPYPTGLKSTECITERKVR